MWLNQNSRVPPPLATITVTSLTSPFLYGHRPNLSSFSLTKIQAWARRAHRQLPLALENRSRASPLLSSVADGPSLSPSPHFLGSFPSRHVSCSAFQCFERSKCSLLDESRLQGCMAGLLPFASLADLTTLFSTNPMMLATNSSMPLSYFDSLCCKFAFGFEPVSFALFDRYSGRAVPVQVVFALEKVSPTSMIIPWKLALPPCECSLRTPSLVC